MPHRLALVMPGEWRVHLHGGIFNGEADLPGRIMRLFGGLALRLRQSGLALRLLECQSGPMLVPEARPRPRSGSSPDPRDGRARDEQFFERKGTTVSVSIKPLEDRVVIRQVEAERTTASGLVIPDTAKEKPQEGEVVAVGPGRIDDNGNRVPLDVKVGDVVIYSRYGGTEVKYGAEEFQILSARDVLAIVER